MENKTIFQAIGILPCLVKLSEDRSKPSIIFCAGFEYSLYYIPSNRGLKALISLEKKIKVDGDLQRLIVYPRFTHFPGREKKYDVAFELVGFDRSIKSEGVTSDLADFEFRLCGLWQFIPVCPTPCISVFKNSTQDKLKVLKESNASQRVRLMKASHIPLIWKDSPIKPFKFNPKAEKDRQGKPFFVSIKAKFLPSRQLFGFDSLLGLPSQEAPRFLKASKKTKSEALSEKKQQKNQASAVSA